MNALRLGLITAAFSFITHNALALNDMVFMQETKDGVKSIVLHSHNSCIPQKLPTQSNFNLYPTISKDAKEVVYISGEGPQSLYLHSMNLETFEEKRLTTQPGFIIHPHLSSNSRFLAYSLLNKKRGFNEIVLKDRLTDKNEVLKQEDASLFFPQVSSTGSFVVYQKSINDERREIWLDYQDKRGDIQLGAEFQKCMAPALSFDDNQVAFTCFYNGEWNIFLQDLKERRAKQITFSKANSFAPTFDAKGNIVFASNLDSEDYSLFRLVKNQNTNQYEAKADKIMQLKGSLYAPSISGNLNYIQSFRPELPEPARSSFGATHINGKNYVIGGHKGAEHTYPPESFSDRVDVYDLATQRWYKGSPRPVKAHGFDVETCNGKIYAFGGFAYSSEHKPRWKSLDRVDRYDPKNDTWQKVATMPRRRSSNVAVRAEDKIYLIGGWDSTPKHENDYEGIFHREIDVFDCKTESFIETNLEIPNPLRRAFTAVEKEGLIYLVGGLGVGATHFELLDQVTVFDPKTKTFYEEKPLPFGTFAPAVGIVKEKLHVFGGMFQTGDRSYEYVNHIYRMDKDQWQHTGRYLSESKGFSMVLNIGKQAWVLGGHSYDGNTDEPVNTVEVWE